LTFSGIGINERLIATIPGQYISNAAATLSGTESARDEPQQVVITIPRIDAVRGSRRVRITFRRFKHKFHKRTRWFWTADSAETLNEGTE
jgi:hypothetical protein